jgi:mono/diheme cytochrome c family protein
MRYFFAALLCFVVVAVLTLGLRGHKSASTPIEIFPDMDRQPKYKSQTATSFFPDGRADRPPVPGSVPFELPVENPYLLTGKMGDKWGDGIPLEVTPELLQRGQERFNINCAVCHGATGKGNGITSQYGLAGAANYHLDTYRAMADGQIFYTIAHGKGNMLGYPHVTPQDRWAIVAYVRALQRSQNATLADVPEDKKAELEKEKAK